MTIEEAASQLSFQSPAIPRLGIPAYNWWNEALHGVARAGTATVLPQAIGLAATFDIDLVQEIAHMIAIEGRAKYNTYSALEDRDIYKGLTFWSPNVNIFRDPRWGRGQETYGEDPYLSGSIGSAFVKGLQGDPEQETMLAAACAKHFAVHSGPESERHGFDARVSAKHLYETYLPAFEMLVKGAKVESVMGAYNRTNGTPCCCNHLLLQEILRDEWGFKGHVVSDCGAIRDFYAGHRVTDTAPESAALAIKNGCDLNCGMIYLYLLTALKEGLIVEDDIRRSAVRVLTTRARLGILGDGSEYDQISLFENDTDEHNALALKAAQASMTLLKNDGLLPLKLNELGTIAVIGPNADNVACLEGNYSGTTSRATTFLQGIRNYVGSRARILYSQGSHLYKPHVSNESLEDDRLAEAYAMANVSDVTILCLGMSIALEGEECETDSAYAQGDRSDLELPRSQQRLLETVLKAGKPVVIVLASGSPLNIYQGNAILQAWYPGQAGGQALASIIFGDVSPAGRLPITFLHGIDDLPPISDYAMKKRTYRYCETEPLYPFGFGLSYTHFTYQDARYENNHVYVTVRNEGHMDGDEVVQVYARKEHPNHTLHPSLVGFKRVSIPAGETVVACVELSPWVNVVITEEGERKKCSNVTLLISGHQPDALSQRLTQTTPLEVKVTWA